MKRTIEIIVAPTGEDYRTNERLHRTFLPRCQQVSRRGSRPTDGRTAHVRIPPGGSDGSPEPAAGLTSHVLVLFCPTFFKTLEISMSHYARPWARLARLFSWRPGRSPAHRPVKRTPKLLVIVEGVHDIAFLRGISAMLHAHNSDLPDLGAMEHRGQLVFVPWGGVDLMQWTHRLAPLAKPEFHICDRETSPETELRWQYANVVNSRPGCCAVVTSKRSMENYVHPAAIREANGVDVKFGSNDDVADLIARSCYARDYPDKSWG